MGFSPLSKKLYQILSLLYLFITFLGSSVNVYAGNNTAKLLSDLEQTLKKKDEFEQAKVQRIKYLMDELDATRNKGNKILEFELTNRLYEEYQSYIYDSAFKYVKTMITMADELNNQEYINQSKIELGFTFLSSGLFKEALDTLLSMNVKTFSTQTKINYYNVLARTYYDLGDYHNDKFYSKIYRSKGNQILDDEIALLSDTTAQYWLASGLRRMKSDDYQSSADAFNYAVSHFKISQHDYAISTSSLGWIYTLLNRENDAVDMLIKAAIADIKSSTKETVALRNLAVILYKQGKLDLAFKYINIALDNATFYNARHRKIEISEVLPIIEGKRLTTLETQRKQLLNYGFITTILIFLVTLFAIIIYKQLRNLKAIRQILQTTNSSLQSMNEMLLETNKIKEEYIGYFFNINSEFIDRLEHYQKTINRKITSRQFDDLSNIIKPSDLHKERENLYKNFDRIFLKLFPNFIEEFNKLFAPEDQIVAEHDELLNTDLRIFALIRLGISDSEKIAKFLNYSVNTIYTYKTKLKQKTIVSRDQFDDYIMAIKAM